MNGEEICQSRLNLFNSSRIATPTIFPNCCIFMDGTVSPRRMPWSSPLTLMQNVSHSVAGLQYYHTLEIILLLAELGSAVTAEAGSLKRDPELWR